MSDERGQACSISSNTAPSFTSIYSSTSSPHASMVARENKIMFLHRFFFEFSALLSFASAFSDQIHHSVSFYTRRRLLFQQGVPSCILLSILSKSTPVFSIGEGTERMIFNKKPTAPIEALLPAIQQRLLLEAALELLPNNSNHNPIDTNTHITLLNLKSILPQLDDSSKFKNQNGSQNSRVLQQYPPDKDLRGDVVRAAMNVYQLNLNYDDLLKMSPNEALLITDPEWKKSYIRSNDGLPDLQKVVGADIDVRQLLRNQVQLKIDDAAAELWSDDCDVQELSSLLREASRYFDAWLDRVRDGDVQGALQLAIKQQIKRL